MRAEPDPDFHAFVAARWPALVRYAYLLTGDLQHAEDLVQTALEATWRRWRHVRSDRPEHYVRAAIANRATSRFRMLGRRVREAPLGAQDVAATDPSEAAAVRSLLWAEVLALPPRMRAIVVLRLWEDLSEEDTAAILRLSTGSVKSQLSRAMARLRERGALREAVGLPALTPTSAPEDS